MVHIENQLRDRAASISKIDAQLVMNMAKCLLCKQILVSSHVHDFRTCECGNLSVDGGKSYVRRLFGNSQEIQELSLYLADNRFYHDTDLKGDDV